MQRFIVKYHNYDCFKSDASDVNKRRGCCDLKRSMDCVASATRNRMLARSAKSQQATAAKLA